jgi:hypothetical protein
LVDIGRLAVQGMIARGVGAAATPASCRPTSWSFSRFRSLGAEEREHVTSDRGWIVSAWAMSTGPKITPWRFANLKGGFG